MPMLAPIVGLMAVEVEGFADRGDDALRQRGGLGGIGDRGLHDDEFIAAHSGDGVGFAHQPAQPVGDDLQQLVAGVMAERIVHGLELIEIEMMDRDRFLAVDPAAQRLFEPLVQQHPVGEVGQRVVVRHVFDLDLGSPLLGDVFMGGDPAAVGHRPVPNLEGAPVAQFDDAVVWLRQIRRPWCATACILPSTSRESFRLQTASRRFRSAACRGGRARVAGRTCRGSDRCTRSGDGPASKKHRPCDMLLIAVSNCRFASRRFSSCVLAERDLPFQARAQFLPLGDVLMGGHAAAVRHRIDRIGR